MAVSLHDLALSDPAELGVATLPWYRRYRWVDLAASYIVALFDGRLHTDGPDGTGPLVDGLILAASVRHGKSILASHLTPAWYLATHPDANVILTSYEARFAAQWGRRVRSLVEENPWMGIRVDPRSRAAESWSLAGHRGGMHTAGAGGALTGYGAGALIIDDPIANAEAANSEVQRDNLWEWLQSTALSRLEPGGKTLLIMSRWNTDDVAGRLLRDQPDRWCHLRLPALADSPDDPLGRAPGEALCPERYDAEALARLRKERSDYWFQALWQGRPYDAGAGIFKSSDFVRYSSILGGYRLADGTSVSHRDCYRFATLDLAATTKTSSDYSVLSVFDADRNGRLFYVACDRRRMEAPDHMRWVYNAYSEWGLSVIGIEDHTYGTALIQALLREGVGLRRLKADADKLTRALPAGAFVAEHRLILPSHAPWVSDVIEECVSFPAGTHDDIVDTIAYAVRMLTLGGLALRSMGQHEPAPGERLAHFPERRRSGRARDPILGRL